MRLSYIGKYTIIVYHFFEVLIMPDYQKMYTTLFNAVTDSIRLLQDAQREVEELYIEDEQFHHEKDA